LQNLAEMKM